MEKKKKNTCDNLEMGIKFNQQPLSVRLGEIKILRCLSSFRKKCLRVDSLNDW